MSGNERGTFLLSPHYKQEWVAGAHVKSQANWLLIWIKALHQIKGNFYENPLMIWFCMLPAVSWFSLLLLCFFPFIPVGLLMKTWGSNTPNTPRRHRGRVENIREMHQKHLLLPGVFKLMEELPNYSVRVDLHENAPVISPNTLSVFFIFHPPPHSCFLVRIIQTEESPTLGPPNFTCSVLILQNRICERKRLQSWRERLKSKL